MSQNDQANRGPWSMKRAVLLSGVAVAVAVLVYFASAAGSLLPGVLGGSAKDSTTQSDAASASTGFLHTDGSQIVDADGNPVRLTGLNWFGAETATQAPDGLWSRSYRDMIDQVAGLGYNSLRVPYSNEMLASGAKVSSIDYAKNPDLEGLSPLEVLDKVIGYAGDKGLRVILDRHRPEAAAQSPLWFTETTPESTWIRDWEILAEHFKGNPAVVGADLHNEPNGGDTPEGACWGCGDQKRDWRLAAERAGSAIQQVNPEWLIIVEGVDAVEGGAPKGWWGGNLSGAKTAPVRLPVENKLVYSTHEYANSVFHQEWFDDPSFPENLPAHWDEQWGYLIKEDIAPVLLGEFGSTLEDPQDEAWLKALLEYLGTGPTGVSFIYWSLNPNSGDTGGILTEDWTGVDNKKQDILKPYLVSCQAEAVPTC